MGYHQKKQSICYWVPRKRRQGGRDRKVNLKKTLLRISQSWGEIWTSKFMSLGSQTYSTQKILSKTYYNKTVKNQ